MRLLPYLFAFAFALKSCPQIDSELETKLDAMSPESIEDSFRKLDPNLSQLDHAIGNVTSDPVTSSRISFGQKLWYKLSKKTVKSTSYKCRRESSRQTSE